MIQDQGQQPVPIDYSMEKTSDGWKVYDVTVAGVSLVTNYRSTFNSQVREGGVEKLIKTLADKNRSLIAPIKRLHWPNEMNAEVAVREGGELSVEGP